MLQPLRRPSLLALLGALFLGTVPAQTYRESLAEVSWSFDDAGAFCIAPDPSAGGGTDAPTRVVRFTDSYQLQNLGALGFLSVLLQGGAELSGQIDAAGIAAKLGLSEEDLVVRLGDPPPPTAGRVARWQYRIWIHAAEQLRLRPAIGPLKVLAADAAQGEDLRRIARVAAARIAGLTEGMPAPNLRPLVTALSEMPEGAFVVLVSEGHRLPPPRALMDLAERTGRIVTEWQIEAAAAMVSPAQVAGGLQLSCLPGILGLEVAREFGDHRVDRSVFGVFVDPERGEPRIWASLEGAFDLASLAAGLERFDVPHEVERGDAQQVAGVGISVAGGAVRLQVTARRASLRMDGVPGSELGAEGAALLAERLASFADLPVRGVVGELPAGLGEESMVVKLLPEVFGFSPVYQQGAAWTVRARFANENLATTIEQQVKGLPRLVESQAEALELPETVYELLDEFTCSRDGEVVEARIPLWIPSDAELRVLVDVLR